MPPVGLDAIPTRKQMEKRKKRKQMEKRKNKGRSLRNRIKDFFKKKKKKSSNNDNDNNYDNYDDVGLRLHALRNWRQNGGRKTTRKPKRTKKLKRKTRKPKRTKKRTRRP
tara:strand:- start:174 stop:503 length:330 start_codon:yes stop_codon:yes gene_type:complete